MKRAIAGLSFAVPLALALGACGQASGEGPRVLSPSPYSESAPPPSTDMAPVVESEPIDLVNMWRVSGVEEESPDTWLRLDGSDYVLWRGCGVIHGSWRATGTAFLAYSSGASGECVTGDDSLNTGWLESVTSYRPSGEGWELVDPDNAVVATLTVDGGPEPISGLIEYYVEPPEVTEEIRDALAMEATPLPAGLSPVTQADLVGRWVQVDVDRAYPEYVDEPFAEFQDDRGWSGTDGCNGAQGRWTVDRNGVLLATAGPSTAIGCDGAQVPSWVVQASSAGFDDGRLVLLDGSGSELGVLVRADR